MSADILCTPALGRPELGIRGSTVSDSLEQMSGRGQSRGAVG